MESKESSWENELVLQVLNAKLLAYFNSSRDTNTTILIHLMIDLLDSHHAKAATTSGVAVPLTEQNKSAIISTEQLPMIFSSYEDNIKVIQATAELTQSTEEFYKMIVRLDQLLQQNCFEVSFTDNAPAHMIAAHEELKESAWKGFNVLHFNVFLALSRCKIWPRLFKEIQAGKKKERDWKINTFFELFRNSFIDIVKNGFNRSVISKKHQKDIEKEIIQSLSNNELIQALKDSNIAELTRMLEEGADINSIDGKEKATVAHLACDVGNIDMVRLLDRFKCNWEIEDAEKMTPLFYAMRGENIDVLRFLIEEKKVNIEHEEFMERTPFYWACCLGNLRIIRFMVESGVNINAKTKLKRTALSKACFLGRADVVKYLLSQPTIDYESGDTKGRNPLHNAIFGPRGGREGKKVVPARLNLQVPLSLSSLSTSSSSSTSSSITINAENEAQVGTFGKDCPEAAQFLLEKGANVDVEDIDQSTPLHVACSSEALDSIPLLIAFGANINRQNKFGDTPLHYACKFNHLKTVKLLLERYDTVQFLEDCKGHTAFDTALVNRQLIVYEYLLTRLGRSFFSAQPLSKKAEHLLRIIESTADHKQQRQFLQLFIDNALEESDYSAICTEQLVLALPQLRDMESFILLIKRCQALASDDLLISQLILAIVKARRIDLLNTLNEQFKDRLSAIGLLPNSAEVIECVLNYNDKEIVAVVFSLNLDVLSYTSSLGNKNSFLHELVGRRKTGVITNFAKVVSKKYPSAILRNRFLVQLQGDLEIAKTLVMAHNEVGLTCIEQSVILKFFDIFTILEQMCINSFHFGKKLVDFSIPEFEIVDLSTTDNSSSSSSSSTSDEIPLKSQEHIKEIESTKSVAQYTISNSADESFAAQIVPLSSEARKPFIEKIKSSAPPTFIDTASQLDEIVLPNLCRHQVIGIDLEYWLDNSDAKVAFICTMQLSTITGNFVIDVLKIREQTAVALKSVFESAEYVKVLHGGETDLKLLKKDLDLNLLNIFDTAKAYLKSNESAHSISLQALCSNYLGTALDKSFQTSDWRIRPLPMAMFQYAINDSLLTLMLFFVMKNELTSEDLVSVATSCNRMCYRQLEKTTFDSHKIYVLKDTVNHH